LQGEIEGGTKPQLTTNIPQQSDRPVTAIAEWLSQSPSSTNSQPATQIAGVRLNPTKDGMEVILETTSGKPLQVLTSSYGQTFVANIPNSQLALPEGKLTTKYRRKVITAPLLQRLKEICFGLCQKWGCELLAVNGEEDHLHLLFGFYPQIQLSKFVNNLKTVSSLYIRKEFPDQVKRFYWGKPIFWHSAYFIATCGGVTVETLKQYVQQQDSPTNDEVQYRDSSQRRRQRGRRGDSHG